MKTSTEASTPAVGRFRAAIFGVIATVTGAGVGHLVAALIRPESSPVLAVGSVVIDNTPTPLKTWAIRTFGDMDKLILVGSVAIVTLLLGAIAGLLARRRPVLGIAVLAVLTLAATVAAMLSPTAGIIAVLPGLVTAAVGIACMTALFAYSSKSEAATSEGADTNSDESSEASGVTPSRRILLKSTGIGAAMAVIGVAAGAAGQQIITAAQRVSGTLPDPSNILAKLPEGLEKKIRGITPFRTKNSDFYRVDINLTVPTVNENEWTLKIDGDVENPYELTYQDILDMPLIQSDITMTCVSNEVGGQYAGAARWMGIPVSDLLERAKPRSGNNQVLSTSVDGYTCSTPLKALQDDRGALLAVGMNGEPLPRDHGYPARLITPGLYGYVGATKWVTRLTVTTFDKDKAYWTKRKWSIDGEIKPMARIDTPEPLTTVSAGTVPIAGIAWAQRQGITGVEVKIDDGPWKAAKLGPEVNIDYWRQWWFPWEATPGTYRVFARCRYGDDEKTQTKDRAKPFPDGASGWHEIAVIVD
ncbi:molybdopterin-dependent oxidoreductase [Demetria terragena]|uniref:molybdopterin-dependent oxidoreductase n=1 Tax=Demetria terragena TaxID=63959 RepID=UPI000380C30E|nr:molybdopterin-dependent oxidoreductase [Demetria terragena]